MRNCIDIDVHVKIVEQRLRLWSPELLGQDRKKGIKNGI
jgi:hypothetical protein